MLNRRSFTNSSYFNLIKRIESRTNLDHMAIKYLDQQMGAAQVLHLFNALHHCRVAMCYAHPLSLNTINSMYHYHAILCNACSICLLVEILWHEATLKI